MVFQNQDSVWTVIIILGVAAVIVFAGVITALVKGKLSSTGIVVGLLASMLMSCGALFLAAKDRSDQDASFSQQLMSEYNVTSNRPFSAIQRDLSRHHESRTVFTKDGRDTQIFVKLVSRDDNKTTMEFVVIDDTALYPKSSK